jgi:hypothetical protein
MKQIIYGTDVYFVDSKKLCILIFLKFGAGRVAGSPDFKSSTSPQKRL